MGGIKPLPSRAEHLPDRALAAVQQQLGEATGILRASLFLKGRVISVKLTAATAKAVRHDLGVQAAFMLVRANYDGTATLATLSEANTAFQAALNQKTHLGVIASANCTVDLYFYPAASQTIDPALGQSP